VRTKEKGCFLKYPFVSSVDYTPCMKH